MIAEARAFKEARACAVKTKERAVIRAAKLAAKSGCPVYAYPTPKGFGFDIVPPLGWCIVAQPSGVVTEKSGPIV